MLPGSRSLGLVPSSPVPYQLLPKSEAFIYRDTDRNSERFWSALVSDLRETNSIMKWQLTA